jgi:membrane protease YdiL (CAAX protease family)
VQLSRGVVTAGWLSSMGFVFAHGDVRDWPSLLLVSVLITWLRACTGSIWAGTALHAAFNCSTLVLVVLGPEVEFGAPVAGLGALVAIGLLVLATHTTRNGR